jgi:hypothetical protein
LLVEAVLVVLVVLFVPILLAVEAGLVVRLLNGFLLQAER